jgi:uncharacterized protein (DUF4415 family)
MSKKDNFETREFDFSKARRITPAERKMFRQAYKNTFGEEMPKRGRPPKKAHLKYRDIHLKIHPIALRWAKSRAKKQGVGYQTVINETLLKHAA